MSIEKLYLWRYGPYGKGKGEVCKMMLVRNNFDLCRNISHNES